MTLQGTGLSASYGTTRVLSRVSFSCPPGQILGVVGPNGAGKSTLLKVVAGLVKADEGRVVLDGRPLPRGEVAYLPQRSEIDWDYPAVLGEIVAMGRYPRLGRWRRPHAVDRAKVAQALERMGLTALAERPISALSGGQQQRAFLARALVQEPRLLLLDEPFAGIDAVSEQIVWAQLREVRATGTIIVVVNHDLTGVAGAYDLMLLLAQRAVAFGSPDDVLNPAALQAAYGALPAFIGTAPSGPIAGRAP